MFSSTYGYSERGLSATTQDWYSRVLANGGTASTSTVRAVDEFVRGVNGNGTASVATILSKIKACNLFCGTNATAAVVPLINTVGSTKWSTAGTITYKERNAGAGFTGNGTTGYLLPGITDTNLSTLGDVIIATQSLAPYTLSGTTRAFWGATNGAFLQTYMQMDATNIDTTVLVNGPNGWTYAAPGGVLNAGIWSTAVTSNQATIATYENTTLRATGAWGYATANGNALYVGARNEAGSAAKFFNGPIGAWVLMTTSASTVSADLSALTLALQTFARKLGRPTS